MIWMQTLELPHASVATQVRSMVWLPAQSPGLADRVKSLFRLGPAEADIAVQLTRGSDIQEIAIARGVTINTIRTQLASAMVKVGVRRQAELVAAVAGLDVLA